MKSPLAQHSLRTARFPLLGVAVAFGAGVLLGEALGFPTPWLFAALGGLCFLAATFLLVFAARQQYPRKVSGVLLLASLLLLGIWRVGIHHLPNNPAYFGNGLAVDESLATSLVQIQDIKKGDRSMRLICRVLALGSDSIQQKTVGKLLLYLPFSETSAAIQLGDKLLVSGNFEPIDGPKNPYAFDAKNYWSRKNVYLRQYVGPSENWRHIPAEKTNIYRFAGQLRDGWQNSLRPYLQGDELAVASALLLGKKDLLDQDIRTAYADTGAIHVLAVSGLHVGIVNLLLGLFFGLFRRQGLGWRIFKTTTILVGIWAFALLTGFSPSVQRAALMFSFLAAGQLGWRRAHLFNSLAAAGICILAIDPLQIFQPGFQLSFAAVAGIGLFQRKLERSLDLRFRPTQIVWSAVTVSIAATLGTLPFSLFYFHQFPLYFMLTGSLVVLTAFAIMVLGIAHGFCFLLLPPLADLSGPLLRFAVELQNGIVLLGRQLPGAKQETAWINAPQLWLLLASIVLLGIWLRSRRFGWIFSASLALLGCLIFGYRSSKAIHEQQRTVAYALSSGTVIDVIQGRRAVRLQNEDIEPVSLAFATQNHQSARRYAIDTVLLLNSESIAFENPYFQWHPPFLITAPGKGIWVDRILRFQSEAPLANLPRLDFMLAENPRHLTELYQTPLWAEPTRILLTGRRFNPAFLSSSDSTSDRSKAFHSLPRQGALILEVE